MMAGRCSYGHLAAVFREALTDTRRIEDALRIVDGFRVRAFAHGTSDAIHGTQAVTGVQAVATGLDDGLDSVLCRDRGPLLSDLGHVLALVLSIRGWSSIQIAIFLGMDDASIRLALDDVTRRPALMTVVSCVLDPDGFRDEARIPLCSPWRT